mgnify:CR=1 FL=1
MLEDQHSLNFNVITDFIECIKKLAEDYSSTIPLQVRS